MSEVSQMSFDERLKIRLWRPLYFMCLGAHEQNERYTPEQCKEKSIEAAQRFYDKDLKNIKLCTRIEDLKDYEALSIGKCHNLASSLTRSLIPAPKRKDFTLRYEVGLRSTEFKAKIQIFKSDYVFVEQQLWLELSNKPDYNEYY